MFYLNKKLNNLISTHDIIKSNDSILYMYNISNEIGGKVVNINWAQISYRSKSARNDICKFELRPKSQIFIKYMRLFRFEYK